MWAKGAIMAESEEIRMPDEPARLIQHSSVDVLVTLRSGQGEERSVLAGRCTSPHVRPNGVIIVVRPQLDSARMPPVKLAPNGVSVYRTLLSGLRIDTLAWAASRGGTWNVCSVSRSSKSLKSLIS